MAERGNPLAMPLAMIRMSGLMAPLSSQSQANISPVLPNPVCTSSAIKRMLFLTGDEERSGGPQTGGKSLVNRGGSLEDRGHSLPHQEPTDDDDEGRCRGDQEEAPTGSRMRAAVSVGEVCVLNISSSASKHLQYVV
jgi:hypothetical protein